MDILVTPEKMAEGIVGLLPVLPAKRLDGTGLDAPAAFEISQKFPLRHIILPGRGGSLDLLQPREVQVEHGKHPDDAKAGIVVLELRGPGLLKPCKLAFDFRRGAVRIPIVAALQLSFESLEIGAGFKLRPIIFSAMASLLTM